MSQNLLFIPREVTFSDLNESEGFPSSSFIIKNISNEDQKISFE
jgi:hypothetical protein